MDSTDEKFAETIAKNIEKLRKDPDTVTKEDLLGIMYEMSESLIEAHRKIKSLKEDKNTTMGSEFQ
mgnify:CR=1 FL=1